MARATFFDERGNSVPEDHCSGPSAGMNPWRTQRTRLDSEQRHRPAAEVGVPHHRRLRAPHVGPALERGVVGVDRRAHHAADVERLLAAGVGLLGEHVADARQRRARSRCAASRGRRGRRGSLRRGATRKAFAGSDVGVLVVREQDAARGRQVVRPVLALAVGTHDSLVPADPEVVLGRDRARVVERLLAGQHHRARRRHDEDAARVHQHRRLGVPIRLRADVDAGDDDVDLASRLRELDDPPQHARRSSPCSRCRSPSRSSRRPTARTSRRGSCSRSALSSAAMIRRHSGSASEPSARVGSPSSVTRAIPSG